MQREYLAPTERGIGNLQRLGGWIEEKGHGKGEGRDYAN